VKQENLARRRVGGQAIEARVLAPPPAAVLLPQFAAGIFNENPPHRLGRGAEEVTSATPVLDALDVDEANVRLVHESRGLKRVPRFLARQALGGQLAKFVVHQREQRSRSVLVAGFDLREDAGDVVHCVDESPTGFPVR
jgi:hypothetical protein